MSCPAFSSSFLNAWTISKAYFRHTDSVDREKKRQSAEETSNRKCEDQRMTFVKEMDQLSCVEPINVMSWDPLGNLCNTQNEMYGNINMTISLYHYLNIWICFFFYKVLFFPWNMIASRRPRDLSNWLHPSPPCPTLLLTLIRLLPPLKPPLCSPAEVKYARNKNLRWRVLQLGMFSFPIGDSVDVMERFWIFPTVVSEIVLKDLLCVAPFGRKGYSSFSFYFFEWG